MIVLRQEEGVTETLEFSLISVAIKRETWKIILLFLRKFVRGKKYHGKSSSADASIARRQSRIHTRVDAGIDMVW